MNIEALFLKKRLHADEKAVLATFVIEQALEFIEQHGDFCEDVNIKTKPKEATYRSLQILLSTPFTKLPDTNYMIDIWSEGMGKVFSAHWETTHENVEIICFKRGGWLGDLT